MADERGVAAVLAEPRLLERQAAEHVVHQPPHLFDPPAGPGPNLRRRIVEDRNAVDLRPAGDPPVEARIVDQHHGVGPMVAEIAVGPAGQVPELVQVHQHAGEPHHGQGGQIGVQLAAGLGHFRPAVADRPKPRAALPAIAESGWPRADRRSAPPAEKKIVSGLDCGMAVFSNDIGAKVSQVSQINERAVLAT